MSKEILVNKLRKLVAVCDQVSVPLPKSRWQARQKDPKPSMESKNLSKKSLRNPFKSLPRMLQTWSPKIKIKSQRSRPNFLDIKLKRRLLWNLLMTSRAHMRQPKRRKWRKNWKLKIKPRKRQKKQNHQQMHKSKISMKRPQKQLTKPRTKWQP